MSIILNVVQQYVLEKACDLTCEAALTVLRIWSGPKLKAKGEQNKQDKPKSKEEVQKPEPLPKPEALPPPCELCCQSATSPEIPKVLKHVGRDAPRFNSGSIDPPRCSCMRLCRDSYFS